MHLHEISLLADDLALQRQFYAGTLGLPIVADWSNGFTVLVGESRRHFEKSTGFEFKQVGAYHFAFNIPENQIAAGKTWLSLRQPLITNKDGQNLFDFENWQAHSIYAFESSG